VIKLEIYGLYKFVTVSPRPKSGTRPGIFDWTGSAKWDAWDAAGQKYEGQGVGAAEARYIEIARSLGWPGLSFPVDPTSITSPSKGDEVDLEHLDDDDDDPPPHGKHGGGSLGVHVSSLGKPEEDKDTEDSLHGYALSGDVAKLESLLESGTVDVDNRDQYGFTALHLASDRGHTEIVHSLLNAQATKDLVTDDEDKMTALDLAKIGGHDNIVHLLSYD